MNQPPTTTRKVTVNLVLGIVIILSGAVVCFRGIRTILFQSEYSEFVIAGSITCVIGLLIAAVGIYVVIRERREV